MSKKAAAKAAQPEETQVISAAQGALPAIPVNDWGSEGISNSDILISKLLLMQGLSEKVSDGEASVGQIRDSVNNTLLGGFVKPKEMQPVQMICFSSFKTWVIFEKRGVGSDAKDEYVGTVPFSPENEGWAISEIVNGVEVRRDKCLNFYVLLPSEIEEGVAFPYLVSFRRTSSYAGKKLATIAAKLKLFKKPLSSKVIELKVAAEENDKGKFFVFDVADGRAATPKEIQTAYEWYQTLKVATVKVDDSDLKSDKPAEASKAKTAMPQSDGDY